MKLKKDERRRIFHKHVSIPRPEEWARDEWPEGMASHLERLAGIDAGIWVTGDYACRNALANLPVFHFITEKPLLRRGGVAAIVGALRRIFPDVPAWVLSHDVPDKNRFATSARVHETALADFERAFSTSARERFENASHTRCTRRVLDVARGLPTFWKPAGAPSPA